MSELAILSYTTLFATIGPLDVALIFSLLVERNSRRAQRVIALQSTLIASAILFVFGIFGNAILKYFGIGLPALKIAGGILLLIISIDLVFARSSGITSTTDAEYDEAVSKNDIRVFPIAMPLIAGPGSIGAIIILMADTRGDYSQIAIVLGSLFLVLLTVFLCMISAIQLKRIFGKTGISVIMRVFGIILSALAIQFIINGITDAFLK